MVSDKDIDPLVNQILNNFNNEELVVYDYGHYGAIRTHLDKYFNQAMTYFNEEDYGLAAFFSVTLIEECGKLAFISHTKDLHQALKKGFRKHSAKYIIALYMAVSYAIAQSALSRDDLKGEDNGSNKYLINVAERLMDAGKAYFTGTGTRELFRTRNAGLYLDFNADNQKFITPNEAISSSQAHSLVWFAGEMYAVIQDFYCGILQGVDLADALEHTRRIYRLLDEFREKM